jgi:hypothetical protein
MDEMEGKQRTISTYSDLAVQACQAQNTGDFPKEGIGAETRIQEHGEFLL